MKGIVKALLIIAAVSCAYLALPPLARVAVTPALSVAIFWKTAQDPLTTMLHFGVSALNPLLQWKSKNGRVLVVDLPTQTTKLHASAPPKTSPTASRLVCISDIHTLWDSIEIPSGDTLIIAGDIFLTDKSPDYYISQFQNFLVQQKPKFKEIIVIAGNHDRILQSLGKEETKKRFLPATYLENDKATTTDNITIFGSPWSAPEQSTHIAFQFKDADQDKAFLAPMRRLEPNSIDVLVTHSIGGADSELVPIIHKLNPQIHVSGHYHSDHGAYFLGKIAIINAASLNNLYLPVNPVVVVDIEKRSLKN